MEPNDAHLGFVARHRNAEAGFAVSDDFTNELPSCLLQYSVHGVNIAVRSQAQFLKDHS
jgi:hypothetical protein